MLEETLIALKNYEWLVKHREGLIDWEVDAVIWGEGAGPIAELCEAGLTPATRVGTEEEAILHPGARHAAWVAAGSPVNWRHSTDPK